MKISEIEKKRIQSYYDTDHLIYAGRFNLYKENNNYYLTIVDDSSSKVKRKVLSSEDISNTFKDYFELQI